VKSSRMLAPLLVALLSSGCTSLSEYLHNGFKVGPNYVQPATAVAPHWIDADDVRIRSDSDDLTEWWKVFKDPVLDDLVCHAYRQNLTLRQAGFRILQARAQLGITVGEVFPQSQAFSGSTNRNATSIASILGGPFGSFGGANASVPPLNQYFSQATVNFGVAWELDFWGRFRRAVEASSADLDASVAGYDDVLVTMLGDVATNYVQFRVLQRQIELLRENVRLQRESLKIAQARFDVGKTNELDVAQSKSVLYQVQAQISQTQIRQRASTNRLCVLLGIPPEDLEKRLAQQTIPDAPKEVAAGIPADLLRRRPDVRRAERQAASESALIGVAQSELYPHISISGTLGWQAPTFQQLFTSQAFQGNIGPSFQWNVLNYGRLVNKVRFQRARFQEVVAAYQNKVLTAAEEVENGMVTYIKAYEQVKHLTDSVIEAKKAHKIGFDEFQTGKVDFNRVAVLEQNLVQQQNILAQAQGDVALGLIQIYRALGGGWPMGNACGDTSCGFLPAHVLATDAERARPATTASPGVRARIGQPVGVAAPAEKDIQWPVID
jgi:NodT family efflux transporter outer membrane factor (OMF) lipoprotein